MEPIIHHHLIDRLAMVAAVFSGLALYPQAISITLSGSTVGVSPLTYAVIFVNSFVWLAYGIHRGLLTVGIASVLNIFASGIVLWWFAIL